VTYFFVLFKNGGFLCTDHASEEDWDSFRGVPVVHVEFRVRKG